MLDVVGMGHEIGLERAEVDLFGRTAGPTTDLREGLEGIPDQTRRLTMERDFPGLDRTRGGGCGSHCECLNFSFAGKDRCGTGTQPRRGHPGH